MSFINCLTTCPKRGRWDLFDYLIPTLILLQFLGRAHSLTHTTPGVQDPAPSAASRPAATIPLLRLGCVPPSSSSPSANLGTHFLGLIHIFLTLPISEMGIIKIMMGVTVQPMQYSCHED